MNKLVMVILSTLLLVGCQRIESNTETDISNNDIIAVTSKDDYSDSQNDLVYRDYGTGIKLSNNTKLMINQLDLNLKDDTAIICAINLENNEAIKLCDYQLNQNISFTPNSEGVYKIIAEISNGEIIDITSKAITENSYSEENSRGFLPLK